MHLFFRCKYTPLKSNLHPYKAKINKVFRYNKIYDLIFILIVLKYGLYDFTRFYVVAKNMSIAETLLKAVKSLKLNLKFL